MKADGKGETQDGTLSYRANKKMETVVIKILEKEETTLRKKYKKSFEVLMLPMTVNTADN